MKSQKHRIELVTRHWCEQLPQQPAAPKEAEEETTDNQKEETKAPTKEVAGDEGVSQNRTDEHGADESLATETADASVVTEAADESAITGMTTTGHCRAGHTYFCYITGSKSKHTTIGSERASNT